MVFLWFSLAFKRPPAGFDSPGLRLSRGAAQRPEQRVGASAAEAAADPVHTTRVVVYDAGRQRDMYIYIYIIYTLDVTNRKLDINYITYIYIYVYTNSR